MPISSGTSSPHCVQYTIVGFRGYYVHSTEGLTDAKVRGKLHQIGIPVTNTDRLERFNRCPTCEVWTTSNGELRKEIDCPAVQQALKEQEQV